jgi:hypothetical protein
VTPSGTLYVTGATDSADFPTTPGAYDHTKGTGGAGEDAFALALAPDGASLVFSTFLGGDVCSGRGVAVDSAGAVYVAGTSSSPLHTTTSGAFDRTFEGSSEGFLAKLTPDGTNLVYSTLLGGNGDDMIVDLSVNAAGVACVSGWTTSSNFFTTFGAFDGSRGGYDDVFVAKVASDGRGLVFSTLLGGGSAEFASGSCTDAAGSVYIVGTTYSADFPTTPGAMDQHLDGDGLNGDGFVTKLNANGTALVYSTYLGGTALNEVNAIAVDASGAAYVTGTTRSPDFPVTPGSFDPTYHVSTYGNVFVTKFAPDGASLAYSGFAGGSRYEVAYDIAVDGAGAACVTGESWSVDFARVGAPFDSPPDLKSAFVTKVVPNGASLAFSTRFGGVVDNEFVSREQVEAVAIGGDGSAYIVGTTDAVNFPTTPGSVDPVFDNGVFGDIPEYNTFVTKVSADGATLVYSTYLGGLRDDIGHDIAVDASGAAFVVGTTNSPDFPTTPGAYDTGAASLYDAFVTKLSPDGSSLVYSTLLGDLDNDAAQSVAVGTGGVACVAGAAGAGFPTTSGAYDTTWNGNGDVFVAKVSADGTSLVRSTFVGGSSEDGAAALALDAQGAVYVTGQTRSSNFPVSSGAAYAGNADAFVAKLDADLGALIYARFLGGTALDEAVGIAVDGAGQAVLTGNTSSAGFPVTPGAFDTSYNGGDAYGGGDAFVTKLTADGAAVAYSTFLGGGDADAAGDVATDAAGSAWIVGETGSADFPTTSGAFEVHDLGNAFATRLSADGASVLFSTKLGGDSADVASAVALDRRGGVYVAGYTWSSDFAPAGFGYRDGWSAFLIKLASQPDLGADTVGVYSSATGAWFLKNANAAGSADVVFGFGPANAGLIALRGDWNGDGTDTPGLYDPSTGNFFLKNASAPGAADVVFSFGAGGAGVIPVVGDFDGDGVDTVGIYIQSTGAFFLKNTNAPGPGDVVFSYGPGGTDIVPVFGDYDGSGTETVGIYNRSSGVFFLKNANGGGAADLVFGFGPSGAGIEPVIGDYDGNGTDTVGVYIGSTGAWFLKNANVAGSADVVFSFGPTGVKPLIGDWNGQ